jgi:DNA repair photolyase
VKPGAPALLEGAGEEIYRVAPIAVAGDTDIYQPIERELKITRGLLEILSAHDHPVNLITKSALVLRDLDILARMAAKGLVSVAISFTTLDRDLSRTMEPRCAAPHRRIETMRELAKAGIPVTAMTAPLIPALNEPELEALLDVAAEAGATRAGYVLLRLPLEIASLFTEWLEVNYPDRAKRVMALLRSCHAARTPFGLEDPSARRWSYAKLIADRFHKAIRRLGLNKVSFGLRTDLFRPPVLKDPGARCRCSG